MGASGLVAAGGYALMTEGSAGTTLSGVGIVGVGMDSLKTFNISSTSAIVAAACGVPVHKVGAPGMTSITGCADAFMLWGVDGQGPLDGDTTRTAEVRIALRN